MTVSVGFKSFASAVHVARKFNSLEREEVGVLVDVAVAQNILRNNIADGGWVLAADVTSFESRKRKKILEHLVQIGWLIKHPECRPSRYQIPVRSIGF